LPQLRDRERSKANRPLSDLPLLAGLGSIESSSGSELENDERTARSPGLGF
jgi:hypothetical protein